MTADFPEAIKAACVKLDLEGELKRRFPNFESRCPPMVTTARIPGQALVCGVWCDVTIRASEGDEKAYVCQSWDDKPLIQHLTTNFAIYQGELEKRTTLDVETLVRSRFLEAIENMRPVHLAETTA